MYQDYVFLTHLFLVSLAALQITSIQGITNQGFQTHTDLSHFPREIREIHAEYTCFLPLPLMPEKYNVPFSQTYMLS